MMATISLSESLREAIQHNNDGVFLIESGCYQEARRSLQTALTQTRTVTRAMQQDGILPKHARSIRYRWAQSAPLNQAKSDPFVFRRALSIVPVGELELSSCRAESTTMLYNLGLSFHLEGASIQHDKVAYSQMLQRALECYRVAVSMRQKPKSERQSSRITGEQLFDLGIANNAAEIHLSFMNYEEAAVFYEHISEILPRLKDLLPREDLTGFCLNLASFTVPRMAAAA